MAKKPGVPTQPTLHGATLESTDGKWVCTLQDEHGEVLEFHLSDTPTVRFAKTNDADNTCAHLTITVRVEHLATVTKQPELI